MAVTAEPWTDVEVLLGVRFTPKSGPLTVSMVEVVMRDFRICVQAAALAGSPRLPTSPQAAAQLHPVNARFLSSSVPVPLPVVQELRVGSLVVVLDLTRLLAGAGGLALVGRLLSLVERYFNMPLRLKVEAETLRAEITRVKNNEDADGHRKLETALTVVELSTGKSSVGIPKDLPETSKVIDAEVGVVAGTIEELDADLSWDA